MSTKPVIGLAVRRKSSGEILKSFLQELPCMKKYSSEERVALVNNSQELLNLLAINPCRILIIQDSLSELSGIQVLNAIKMDPKLSSLAIRAAIFGQDSVKDLAEARNALLIRTSCSKEEFVKHFCAAAERLAKVM